MLSLFSIHHTRQKHFPVVDAPTSRRCAPLYYVVRITSKRKKMFLYNIFFSFEEGRDSFLLIFPYSITQKKEERGEHDSAIIIDAEFSFLRPLLLISLYFSRLLMPSSSSFLLLVVVVASFAFFSLPFSPLYIYFTSISLRISVTIVNCSFSFLKKKTDQIQTPPLFEGVLLRHVIDSDCIFSINFLSSRDTLKS